MAYVDQRARRIDPASLAAVGAIHLAVLGALLTAKPEIAELVFDTPLTTTNVPIPVDPIEPPDDVQIVDLANPRPQPAPPPSPSLDRSKELLPFSDPVPFRPSIPLDGLSGIGDRVDLPPPPAPPAIVEPKINARYAGDFQPAYPPGKLREEENGSVTVRVLVGVDGRVKQIERISATDDAFWLATERQALRKWRFQPGTIDGKPAERWFQATVKFEVVNAR